MLEAIIIILALGGLEFALWYIERKGQHRQIELLDAIWTELALLNANREDRELAEPPKGEGRTRAATASDAVV